MKRARIVKSAMKDANIVIYMNLQKSLQLLLHSCFGWLQIAITAWTEKEEFAFA